MQCVWSALPSFLGNQAHDKMACFKPHPPSVADPNLARKQQRQQQHQFKRKRSNTLEPSPPAKRQRPDIIVQAQSPAKPFATALAQAKATVAPSAVPHVEAIAPPPAPTIASSTSQVDGTTQPVCTPQQQAEDVLPQMPLSQPKVERAITYKMESVARTHAHERIEANLNLQVLLKHDELRLIEQELGKCQVALEQLRRCKTIPFPGQPGSPISADSITCGTGPAIQPPPGLRRPSHMPPFGVTDGPYSRHYAQWLIPDPTFDPSPPRPPRLSTTGQSVSNRSVRGSYDSLNSATTPRSGRMPISSHSATMPSTFSVPRDRHAPLTVSRPSDGKLVKMVCKVCGKKDSANVQGFTNHCRIAHGINYASHSEAIVDCGQLVGNEEAHTFIPPPPSEPNPVNVNISTVPQNTGRPFVHPLITAPPKGGQSLNKSVFGNAAPPSLARPDKESSALNQDMSCITSTTQFVASPGNPHLSALLKKRGFEGDLKHLITTSKQKIDLNQVSPLVSDNDEDMDQNTPQNSAASTPQRPITKPKSRRANIALGGAQTHGRPQNGPSKLKINTSSSARTPASEARSAQTPQPNSASNTFTFVPHRPMVPGSLFSKSTNGASHLTVNRSLDSGGRRMASVSASSTVSSPMEVDELDAPRTPEESCETSGSSTNLSPHTIDTNPGLVTDNEDDADYADSEQDDRENVDAASNSSRHIVDVGVKVHEDDGLHADELLQHLEQSIEDEEKSKGPRPILNGDVHRQSSVVSGGTSTPRKRGRPRKNP